MQKRYTLKIINRITIALLLTSAVVSANPFSWKTFTSGKYIWMCSSSEIYQFSTDSRSVFPVDLDKARSVGTIEDVIQYENMLIFSTQAGLYQYDMATQSVERITFPDEKNKTGKVSSDMDYLWLVTSDSLYRFDKLGREWFAFAIPEKDSVLAISCDGELISVIGNNKSYVFTVSTEKWNIYPFNDRFSTGAYVFNGMQSHVIVDGNRLAVYKKDNYSWESIKTSEIIKDISIQDTVLYYSTARQLFKMSNGFAKPINIPQLDTIHGLAFSSDTAIIIGKNRVFKFNTKTESISFVEYTIPFKADALDRVCALNSFIVLLSKENVFVYDGEQKKWNSDTKSANLKQARFSWGEAGPIIEYKPGVYTNVKGSVESITTFKSTGFEKDSTFKTKLIKHYISDDTSQYWTEKVNDMASIEKIDSTMIVTWTKPNLIANVSVHTTDDDGRYGDLFFNNSNLLVPPQKGFIYKGISSDRLNLLSAGTRKSELLQSITIPKVQFEGGEFIIESKKKVAGRDRKMLRIGAGAGYITSKTEWRVLPVRSDGRYRIVNSTNRDTLLNRVDTLVKEKVIDTTQIIPGSLKVFVDGTPLDSARYSYYSETGTLQIDPTTPIDIVSFITVSYEIQTIPESGVDDIIFKPDYDFGKLYYGTIIYSPKEWISSKISYTGVDNDTLNSILNVATPIEYRSSSTKFLLKCTPEISWAINNNSKAAGLDFQSRIGDKLGIQFNGKVIDTSFTSVDSITYGFGKLKNEYTGIASFDIAPEIPISYTQQQIDALMGSESKYSFGAGLHFPKKPFFDVTLSRTKLINNNDDDDSIGVFDSLFTIKDRINFNLYETSSPILEKILRSKKLSYNLNHSEYRFLKINSDMFQNGRRTDLFLLYMPIQDISMTNYTIYKHGGNENGLSSSISEIIEVQSIDAPNGLDIQAEYKINMSKYNVRNITEDSISRRLGIVLKPGEWHSLLRWFNINGSVAQNVNCLFNDADPSFWAITSARHSEVNSSNVKIAGINLFPNEMILFRNSNQWTESDSNHRFSTANDLQLAFNSKNVWQNNCSFSTNYNYYTISGFSIYDWTVNSWLRLTPEVNVNFNKDSTGANTIAGPRFSVNINTRKFYFVKSFFNVHKVTIDWKKHNGILKRNPTVGYMINAKLVLMPNIEITNQEMLVFERGKLNSLLIKIGCNIIF
jgi:hypothetical protein